MVDELLLYEQFRELNIEFPKLRLQKEEGALWVITGLLKFSAEYSGNRIDDEYSIELIIPEDYPNCVPKAKETGNRIPDDFHHYQDDSLCLGAQIAIRKKFAKQPTLAGFVKNCLVPYLYSYSFNKRYSKMPFGELSHGAWGILEYYEDLFALNNHKAALGLIEILAKDNYRGHKRCPCGSGKRLRACHGNLMIELKVLQPPSDFNDEYHYIIRSLVENQRSFSYDGE